MDERVAAFVIDNSGTVASPQKAAVAAPAAKPAAARPPLAAKGRAGAAKANPVAAMRTTLATALKEDAEWKQF